MENFGIGYHRERPKIVFKPYKIITVFAFVKAGFLTTAASNLTNYAFNFDLSVSSKVKSNTTLN